MLIKLHHAKSLNYCSKGMRHWCKQNGISYLKFIKEGIEEELLIKSNDTMAIKVVEYAKKKKREKWAEAEAASKQ